MLKREDFTPERIDALIEEARRHGPYDALTHEEREQNRQHFLSSHQGEGLWVFGYGSLLWNPAFNFEKSEPAKLFGFHRKFCLQLSMGRGSPQNPGLMLALDHGGSCNGRAFFIPQNDVASETKILWMREMLSGAYKAKWCKMKSANQTLSGLTFVINRNHARYITGLEIDKTIELLATGSGHLGSCRDYLENTIDHLDEINVRDHYLHLLRNRLRKKYPDPKKN